MSIVEVIEGSRIRLVGGPADGWEPAQENAYGDVIEVGVVSDYGGFDAAVYVRNEVPDEDGQVVYHYTGERRVRAGYPQTVKPRRLRLGYMVFMVLLVANVVVNLVRFWAYQSPLVLTLILWQVFAGLQAVIIERLTNR